MNGKMDEKIKKHSRIRLWFQAAWFALTNGYVRGYTKGMIFNGGTKVLCLPGLNCYSCPGALGACPMGALQAVLGNASYRVSLYVFGCIAAMGVIFGRLICGWMCPFGLFQDLLYRIKTKAKRKNLPGHKYLKYLRYVILVVFPILLVSVMLDVTGSGMPWFCERNAAGRHTAGRGKRRASRRGWCTFYLENVRIAGHHSAVSVLLPSVLQISVPAWCDLRPFQSGFQLPACDR